MVLTAVRGALGFLTRLPIGRTEEAWLALGAAPAAMVLAGYVVGGLVALPFALPLPTVTLGLAYVVALVAVTGITHLDGLADLGDAAAVHGEPARRREVMGDASLGVGGTVAVAVDVLGLTLAGVALAGLPIRVALGLVVASEVGAKLSMVVLSVLGRAAHEGLGASLTGARPRHLIVAGVLAAPGAVLAWPTVAGAVSLATALAVALGILWWARARIGGVTGDVFGATNELARLAALHAGVVAWTLS